MKRLLKSDKDVFFGIADKLVAVEYSNNMMYRHHDVLL